MTRRKFDGSITFKGEKHLPFSVQGHRCRVKERAGVARDLGYQKRGVQAGWAQAPASGPRVDTRVPCGA